MNTQFVEAPIHSLSTPERVQWLNTRFETPEITAAKIEITAYDFRWATFLLLLAATGSIFLGLWSPGAGLIGSIIIAIMAIREFYHPFIARFKGSPAENLYYTIPARSKETQRLYLVATYATDSLFAKPQSFNFSQMLIAHHLVFICQGLINVAAYFTGIKTLWFIALIPLLSLAGWNFTFPKEIRRDASSNCTVLADLKNLLTKARPLSTSVIFAFLGSRSLHSGAYHLLSQIKKDPKITYVVNLTDCPDGNDPLIITSEGAIFPQSGDPTLIELLQIVADEKGITVAESNTADLTEIFPLLLNDTKAVSIATPQAAGSDHHRHLRELLAGLIRKIEH